VRIAAQVGLRVAAIVAAAFSSAAAVDYYGRSHTFCTSGSGCDAVRHSAIGESFGHSLPAIGMLGYAAILLLSLSSRASVRLWGHVAAMTGAITGIVLLLLQAGAVGRFCTLCVGVDVAAIVAGVAALQIVRERAEHTDGPITSWPLRAAAVLALAAALVGPFGWALRTPSTVPTFVASMFRSGKINVIEFSDFECPYCRALHPRLAEAMAPYGDAVNHVRVPYPLSQHRHARKAARAYLCAARSGHGEAMADGLFEANPPDAAAIERLSSELGLDRDAFSACLRDSEVDARIEKGMEGIRASNFHGLPTVWIEDKIIEGFDAKAGSARYAEALARAARKLGIQIPARAAKP